ncbi:hypothetical protein GCM10025781_26480 [Kocuria gwangalliensis]|uniref:Uncharacterized protein n=1 Tax=Kocuria gwangalliensis TaxID=501592 RepID=A0ABP8XEC5_9MICC
MLQVPFNDLAQSLKKSGLPGTSSSAFGVPENADFFVDPVLVVKEKLSDLSSEVILVSARGAAGKSRTALELAARSGAPLWRLEADDAVGRAALPLKLNTYLSSVDAFSDIAQLPERPALFIDSLDEARSRVSSQSWEEFLDSISEAASRGLQVVLFGRDRTLEDVWLKLEDAGRSIAWLEVSHFPNEAQRTYIDSRTRENKKNVTIDTDDPYYQEAREELLTVLSRALDAESAETFVGYPPVLDAVATVLVYDQNHFKLAQEFSSQMSGSRPMEVLRRILADLLIREQGKLKPLAEDLGLDPTAVYSADEQIQWLWHDLINSDAPNLEYISDAAKRHDYQRGLQRFLDDHPFRAEKYWASTVFEAYATAERIGKNLSPGTLYDVGTHSGLLFDFTATAQAGSETVLDEWQFAALHASILAGESPGSAATVSAVKTEDEIFNGSMEVTRTNGTLHLEFALVPDDPDSLVLVGPLESLTISTPGAITIPPLDKGRLIGPDLFLRCDSIKIEGTDVQFARTPSSAAADGMDIHIEVTGSNISLAPSISVAPTSDSFELAVSESVQVAYPWFDYRTRLETDDAIDLRSKTIRFLSKLQNLARTHGHSDGRATFFMKLQGRQPLKAAQLREVLSVLKSKGAIRFQNDLIFLTSEADQHRFSGKALPGQRTILQEWDYWGPIVEEIEKVLEPA